MNHTMRKSLSFTTITALVCACVVCHAGNSFANDKEYNEEEENKADKPFPRELVDFAPYEQNPLMAGRGEGYWDEKLRERGWILREEGLYRMWYTGYQGDGLRKLGYATSKDGLKWGRHAGNPLDNQHWIEDMMVVKHEGEYFMFAEGNRKGQSHLLTSRDGLDWKWQGPLDIRKKEGEKVQKPCGTPFAWVEDGLWHLTYEIYDKGIWVATSPDLKVWTNLQDESVLQLGPEPYDQNRVAVNQVIRYEGRYYLYYHGYGESDPWKAWTTNVAVSTDLVHWKKFPGNPLTPPVENKSSGILVHDGEKHRLYTMHPEVNVHFPR